MTKYKVETVIDTNELARVASQLISLSIKQGLSHKDRFQIALSGGSTPSETYKLLGQQQLEWNRVDIFLGDERWVDMQDHASNAGMVNRTLFLNSPASQAMFYPVQTVQLSNPQESAKAYSHTLENVCLGVPPQLDLILLGLGDDGHTASLFPYSESLNRKDCWATVSNAKGHDRITLTAPVLSAARKIIFLVSGSSKQQALRRLIDPLESTDRTPARLVEQNSEILIYADEASSALI